jgi:hypothetical protein
MEKFDFIFGVKKLLYFELLFQQAAAIQVWRKSHYHKEREKCVCVFVQKRELE